MKTCPKVCSDIKLNLKNRDWAFKNVGYGPANPDEPEDFWDKRAKEWATTPENAQTMRLPHQQDQYLLHVDYA